MYIQKNKSSGEKNIKNLAKFLESQVVLEEFIKNPSKVKELMLSILKYGYESLIKNETEAEIRSTFLF